MALKMNVKIPNGVIVEGAYVKIAGIGTDKKSANFSVKYYTEKENSMHFYENGYVFAPDFTDDADNLWKQCYKYLKSLPEFEGAEDILEAGQHA